MTRRVVVTGMGALTPLGNSRDAFIEGLNESKVGIDQITHFDAEPTGITVAGEVKDFNATERLERKIAKRMDPFSQYALYTAVEAMNKLILRMAKWIPNRWGLSTALELAG